MVDCQVDGAEIRIRTDCVAADIATSGYTSGVKAGSFCDQRTGAQDLGYGLDIVDFLLEPGEDKEQDPDNPYHSGDGFHGKIAKRYVELPQICTQARSLPYSIHRAPNFVAVRQWFRYTVSTRGYEPGSLWEQTLVFPAGQRYFFACDRVVSANDAESVFLRIDMPGHLRHDGGDRFSSVYLSYHGEIPSSEFLQDFAPDSRFWYRRRREAVPERFIRAYRTRLPGGNGPWLAGMTLNPEDVYEAWCHQRGYVCFIQEVGGEPVRKGEAFGAAYVIGFFDSIGDMHAVYDRFRGWRGIDISGEGEDASWSWRTTP